MGGRIPSYMAGLPLELRFDWDRLLISIMFGASLLTTGLIDYLFKDDRRKEIVIVHAGKTQRPFRSAEPGLRTGCREALLYASLHEEPAWRIHSPQPVSWPTHGIPLSDRQV